jgi:hypothetical protein
MRVKTPAGKPASVISRPIRHAVIGTFSDGFQTKAFPAVIAIGNIHIGTIAGKLNGAMPATTPSGSRRSSQVTPRLTSSDPPSSRFCSEIAYSQTSMPFKISARPSATVLPASAAHECASSSRWASTSSRKRNIAWVRSLSGTLPQPIDAILAAATAAATSSAVDIGTVPIGAPVYGLMTSRLSPRSASDQAPPMRF